MKLKPVHKLIFIVAFLLSSVSVWSQSNKQKELEQRRQELRAQIQKINSLLSENKSQKKSQTSIIEEINQKVNVRRNLIKVTNQQANLLTREINTNQNKISDLREELELLRKNYADMINKAYKSKSKQSKVMFLLSSSDFKQAFKRAKYINQYADYQKQQGESIKKKTQELQEINKSLLVQKSEKQKLIEDNRATQKTLETDLKQHETVMASINKNLSKYTKEIKQKQREANKIDQQIEKIIRDAIAKSNKKAGIKNTKSSGFALTPEAKLLAADFASNKGKLIWPVEKGVVKLRYGNQPHPVVKTVTIKSNGVRISTEANAKVRAVFKGEVIRVQQIKRGNLAVMIKHGNYISVYKNLSKVIVKTGDKITTRQEIGEVFTNRTTGETELSFQVWKDSKTQNPAEWVYKM
ncbi:murein hydrolase activator EnvC family protein [Lacinutrix salivirga]